MKQFSACSCLTRHRAALCALCSVFTVQHGALYSLQWCAVCGVRRAVVCAARPLHINVAFAHTGIFPSKPTQCDGMEGRVEVIVNILGLTHIPTKS